MRLPIAIIGNSHSVALTTAYCERFGDFPQQLYLSVPELEPPFDSSGTALRPEILDFVSGMNDHLLIFSISGNEHNIIGMTDYKWPYDFVLPDEPNLTRAAWAAPVPYNAVRNSMRRKISAALELITALGQAVRARCVLIEPPPPNPSEEHIRAYLDPSLRDFVTQTSIAPPLLRYKLWRVQCSLYQDCCREVGMAYLEAPARGKDADGMLAVEAWGRDATHANSWYGGLVLDLITERYFPDAATVPA